MSFRSLFFLFILLLAGFLAGSCDSREPRIGSLYPQAGHLGDVLTIFGENFGAERNESYVTVGGIIPTSSAYIEWKNDTIVFVTPEFGESGLVYVHRGGKKSNAVLFSNQAVIPKQPSDAEPDIAPRILSIRGSPGAIGSVVTITGKNFGASREGGGVFFSWGAAPSPSAPAENQGPFFVEVSERDFGYELWSEREIRVRVPDGAVSGSLEVRTLKGGGNPEFFEVAAKPGTKAYRDKRNYAISYAVDIKVREASPSNTLYLWVPRPVNSASQRNVELLSRNVEPFVEDYRGTTLFKLTDLSSGGSASIGLSYHVEVYAVETALQSNLIRTAGRSSPLATALCMPSALIPSDDPAVIKQAAAITGREQNLYTKAWKIYQWLITEGGIQAESVSDGASDPAPVLEALEKRRANPYTAALLFCALARASGVPAIPVAGVLIDRLSAAKRHYWAEFWLEGFGWVPLDPALGAGAAPPFFSPEPDAAAYYFGNLDNRRLTFSRGQTLLSPMDPRGRTAVRNGDYALQSLWEEAVGNLESYSSLWSDIIIDGIYAQ
ncbi:MAG: IPT/TIG domain-containing protein [Treponema sp.]|jgi:hypothetical protein|nr:IPT/TIG domain-containing protein [Treponema sp.]